jgi:hypothetical protein
MDLEIARQSALSAYAQLATNLDSYKRGCEEIDPESLYELFLKFEWNFSNYKHDRFEAITKETNALRTSLESIISESREKKDEIAKNSEAYRGQVESVLESCGDDAELRETYAQAIENSIFDEMKHHLKRYKEYLKPLKKLIDNID